MEYHEPEEVFSSEDDDASDDEQVPLFANRENRDLHKKIKRVELKTAKTESQLEDDQERLKAMQEHLKSVQQEFKHAQLVHESKMKELHTELHMKQLAERDAGRIQTEIGNIATKKDDLQSSLSGIQNEIFKENDILDKYKLDMNFNQEELEQWTLAMGQNQDDKDAFERYMKADDSKVKELGLQIEKLTATLQSKRRQLDEEVTETHAKQIELDKTAEEFRTQHRERQEVLQQWQDAVAQVKQRDEDIQKAGEAYISVKAQVDATRKELLAEKSRLENMEQDCAAMVTKSDMVDRVLQKKRATEVTRRGQVDTYRGEVDLLKSEVGKASREVQDQRQKVANEKEAIEQVQKRLDAVREKLQETKMALDDAKLDTCSAELSAGAADETLQSRENELKAVNAKLAALKDTIFKESERLFQFRQKETNLLAEISGAQACAKNLTSEIQKLDEEALKQKEHIYNAEFQIQQMERKVARASGVRSDDEKKILNKRIAHHKEELEISQAQHDMLLNQVKKIENELVATKREAVQVSKKRQDLKARNHELSLENSSGENVLLGLMKKKEEVMVSHDLMKLQVKTLRDQFDDRADKVFGLENRKFQLEASMMERKQEIQVHSDMQRTRAKLAEEERHKLALEANECKMKVDKLEKKFKAISPEGEVASQAYFVIAAAQKREELQREGDTLDAKIRQATREIRALEETLLNINSLNSQSRSNMHRVDPKSKEAHELKRLYEELNATRDICFKKKKELERLENDISEDQQRIAELNQQTSTAEDERVSLDRSNHQVQQEIANQNNHLARISIKLQEHLSHHRISLGIDEESIHETMFKVEMNKRLRDTVLYTIGQLGQEFPEIQDEFQTQLTRFALNIPAEPPINP